jgi:hypothetical protein
MGCSLSMRNSREIRGCEAADRGEPSLRRCHVIRRVMKMTPDMKHLGGFRGKKATIRLTAPQLTASKFDFVFYRI